MNLNVTLFLISSLCSYFANSVNVINYKGAINNESEKKFYNIICSLDHDPEQLEQRLHRATICKWTIRSLRKTNEDGYEDLYMDYLLFKQNPNCNFVDVSIPIGDTIAKHPVIVCPLRPSFIPMDTNQNSNFIAIFPKTTKKMMIFNPILKPDGEIEMWKLSIVIDNFQWVSYAIVSPQVFEITVPDSYSKTQDMFNLLSKSAVHLSKGSEDVLILANIFNICKIVCRPGKYKEFIHIHTPSAYYEKPEVEEVTLFSEEPGNYVQFSLLVYKCYREIQTTPETYVDDYRIAAGPFPDSYLLLHKTENVLKVIEFILDLNIDYIYLYDSY